MDLIYILCRFLLTSASGILLHSSFNSSDLGNASDRSTDCAESPILLYLSPKQQWLQGWRKCASYEVQQLSLPFPWNWKWLMPKDEVKWQKRWIHMSNSAFGEGWFCNLMTIQRNLIYLKAYMRGKIFLEYERVPNEKSRCIVWVPGMGFEDFLDVYHYKMKMITVR